MNRTYLSSCLTLLVLLGLYSLPSCATHRGIEIASYIFPVSGACGVPTTSLVAGIIVCNTFDDQKGSVFWSTMVHSGESLQPGRELGLSVPLVTFDTEYAITRFGDKVQVHHSDSKDTTISLPPDFSGQSGVRITYHQASDQVRAYFVSRDGYLQLWSGVEELEKQSDTLKVWADGVGFRNGEFEQLLISEEKSFYHLDETYNLVEVEWPAWMLDPLEEHALTERWRPRFVFSDELLASKNSVSIFFYTRAGESETLPQRDFLERTYRGLPRSDTEKLRIDIDRLALKAEGARAPATVTNTSSDLIPVDSVSIGVFDSTYQRLLVVSPSTDKD